MWVAQVAILHLVVGDWDPTEKPLGTTGRQTLEEVGVARVAEMGISPAAAVGLESMWS